jgi:endonuclease/exonuclease/phosphatase family metal-dependent hydrolase
VNLIDYCRDDHGRCRAGLLLVAVACAVVLALTGCGQSSPTRAGVPAPTGSTYKLMQMNLCLSGLGACYGKVAYPAGVKEAAARIRQRHPDAITLNEACRGDVWRIARRTGYHVRFSRVIYLGKPLACINPGGRGLFGDAVLTKAPVESADRRPFQAQAVIERRGWLCVSTSADVEVCTAHLATRSSDEVQANDAQCAELRALLMRRAAARTLIFGGDVNRRSSCAPERFWIRSDESAEQDPGLQQVYGPGALHSPSAEVVPATHTDHDFLLVRAHLTASR